ncbi:hypothetical protein M9435_001868 [Picochlorum sp. BPE23]|nr:hypothetical protein M9435_001868 [Picochlorum sp. BPE23]
MSENGTPQRPKTTIHKLVDYFGAITVPGCYDALSVKILQQSGHQAALVSGAAVSATQLGEPDLGLLTPPEMGTIKSLMAAGASGCILEDQAWPKRMGTIRSVVPKEEFLSKIAAARQVIGDADFFLVARTDARNTSAKRGLEEAMIRANLFTDAGADAHLVGGLRSIDELRMYSPTPGYGLPPATGTSQDSWENMVSWRAFQDILGLEDKYATEEHFNSVQGPASNIEHKLRKVKGLVKPHTRSDN